MNFNSWKRHFLNFFQTPFSLIIDRGKHVLSCTCLWAYLKSITVTVLASLTNVCNILRTPNYTGHCHSCVHCGAARNASMAEYSVHAADETLLTFELVIAKDGFDTGILYFCYLSNWQKQASNHTKWVRQIHGWSRKIVQDRHFETKAKTKTGSAETET